MKLWKNRTAPHEPDIYPTAALLGVIGFFVHIFLSSPVLNMLGIPYGSEDAGLLGKIHPGSYIIILAFIVLLCSRRNPFAQMITIARQHSIYFLFFAVYFVIAIYWLLRGPKGIGLIIDIHIIIPMIAIIFSYAPRSWYRPIVYWFIGIASLNGAIGIFESITHLRIFPFNPDWEVLQQDYFRASALRGHPLTNAMFDSISLFVLLNLRMRLWLKACLFLVMLVALVSFGGRAALLISCIGLALLGLYMLAKYMLAARMSVMRLIAVFLALFLVPALCFGLLYGTLHSGMGERLMAYNGVDDDSASVRLSATYALDLMSTTDMIFGMDDEQVTAMGERIGLAGPSTDIENPWLLMFMFLGGIMFPLWLATLGLFLWRLMAGASPILKMTVIDYFCIASTSNSFGRKDVTLMLLVGIIVCAKKMDEINRASETLSVAPTGFSRPKNARG